MNAEMGMRNLLSNLGFTMVKAFPVTNPTDMELVQKHRAAIEAQTAGSQVNTEAQLAHYSQTEALTLARIEMETNVARAEAQGKVTIELESELKELRAQEAKWNAQLTFERGKMEIRSEEADAKTKRAMDMFEQVQARKADRIAKQQDFQNQRMQSQNQFQKDMLELAAQHGALSPEVIQEMLKQQTAQKAIDGSGEETNSDQ